VTNVYDTNSRVTSQTHPDGGVYAFDYSVAGQTKMTAPRRARGRCYLFIY
jgi:YD repeat-containing protein